MLSCSKNLICTGVTYFFLPLIVSFRSMQWNEIKDVLLMREVLGKSVLVHKPGSHERGQGWQNVADTVNSLDKFHVICRGTRNRIMNLVKKYRAKISKEKNETWLGGDKPTEFEVLLEKIINIPEDTLQKKEAENKKAMEKEANERNQVLEIRQIAMEKIDQTKKQSLDDEKAPKQKRSRRSNSETMGFLKQKLELDKRTAMVRSSAAFNV